MPSGRLKASDQCTKRRAPPEKVPEGARHIAGIRLSAIAFRPVMRLAQHLTVLLACGAAATPCGHMVGVHLGFLVDAFRVRIMPDGAQRAIRHVLGLGLSDLTLIDDLGRLLVKKHGYAAD